VPPFKKNAAKNEEQTSSLSKSQSVCGAHLPLKNTIESVKKHEILLDSMDVDEYPGSPDTFNNKCKSRSSESSNKSLRVSESPTPPNTPRKDEKINKKVLKTPVKSSPLTDNDPLRNLKLDDSISKFLADVSQNPSLKQINKDKHNVKQQDVETCKKLYVEILEKISTAFDRIPNCIKEKFPGYDKKTYSKMKYLKSKLKLAIQQNPVRNDIQSDTLTQMTQDETNSSFSKKNGSLSLLDSYDDLADLDLETKFSDKPKCLKLPVTCVSTTSTPDLENTQIIKNDLTSKKLLSFDDFSCNIATSNNEKKTSMTTCTVDTNLENINHSKGKFVFKQPSRLSSTDSASNKTSTPVRDVLSNTLVRLKSASEKFKPLQLNEPPKGLSIANSSVEFQPPQFSTSSLLNIQKPCTFVSPIIKDSHTINDDEEDLNDYEVSIDVDDDDILIEQSKQSVISIHDSEPGSSIVSENKLNNIHVDEDGWPEYRVEDFEEDIDALVTNEPEVMNLMENSIVKDTENKAKYEGMGDFHAGTKNDGITGEFDGLDYPHSSLMMEMFQEKFGLKTFRPNQLQVINATLLGHDCFVLMPTGGGKSLCYQLPAILTPGVTIVISPLKSLILDQVNKLLSLDIPAAHLSGDVSLAACDEVYHKLSLREPLLKLLYVTPEKISNSPKFQAMLDTLYSRGKIARFVIDEAHCPTPRVRMDILHQLKVTNCKWFLCSFNRPNLCYRILEKKPKSVNQDVANLIKEKYFRVSGIVYCLSRKECDSLTQELRRAGVQAAAYHAGLSDKQRGAVQAGWVADRHKVICATIAFGMGVDKADVRFVIHHSMPKSVEGYYQEAGRAGRDGELADCILYYSYADVIRYRRLFDLERNTTPDAKRVHIENLLRMVEVCESVTECRRVQVLAYLGERYGGRCQPACDTCLQRHQYKPVDVTEECRLVARCVREAGGARHTLLHVADALRGLRHQRLHALTAAALHGRCKSWQRSEPARLLRWLVARGILAERLVLTNDIAAAYLVLGPNVDKLMSGGLRIVFPMLCHNKDALPARRSEPQPQASPVAALIQRIEERCYADLVEACREMGEQRGASLAAVLPQAALRALATRLPEKTEDMLSLPHITRANYDKYGAQLLNITSAYAVEKIGLLMQYQDELEEENKKEESTKDFQGEESGSDTDWAGLGRQAGRALAAPAPRGRRPARGGVRKRYVKRKRTSSPKKKALRGRGGGKAAAGSSKLGNTSGNKLGSMPVPRTNPRPGVISSRLNLL
ncbi:hypothetical protein ACJJTC_017178, partial [Scirpophaga incertulas]